jgi:hypothetical protein
MTTEHLEKAPSESLANQTELMEKIASNQQKILDQQQQISKVQISWLKSIDSQVEKQTHYLKNINIVAIIFVVLLMLSFCFSLIFFI